jgi:ATP-dependent helicase HrpB
LIPAFEKLPLYADAPRIAARIAEGGNLLLTAPTGSGKSSFIPWLLSKEEQGKAKVVVLQPRRLAALSLANYLSTLCEMRCGGMVGYKFRFDSQCSDETRFLFQTYGSFLQTALRGKTDADWIVFDEFHERRAEMDLLIAYFLALQKRDPAKSPRLAVLSAELNRESLEKLLQIPCMNVGKPGFPVQILRQSPLAGNSQGKEIVRALRTLNANGIWKTTLVFLPGKGEIAGAHRDVEEAFGYGKLELLDLYGGQDMETQRRIFRDTESPRVIFTTNIAETSLTVPQVTGVIDSGLERTTEFQVKTQVSTLKLSRISLQNSIQRTGRAGRTQAGVCIRLWDEREEALFPKEIIPEVLRSDLCPVLLSHAMLAKRAGIPPETLALPTPFPAEEFNRAKDRLLALCFLETDGSTYKISSEGEAAIDIPVNSPELAKCILSADGLSDLTLGTAAVLDAGPETFSKAKTVQNVIGLAKSLRGETRGIPRELQLAFRRLQDYRRRRDSGKPRPDSEESTVRTFFKAFPTSLAIKNGNVYRQGETTIVLPPQETGDAEAILAFGILRADSGRKTEIHANLYIPVPKAMLAGEAQETRYELLWRSGQERFIGLAVTESAGREIARKEIQPQESAPDVLAKLKELTGPAWMEMHRRENLSHLWMDDANTVLLRKMKLAQQNYPDYGLPAWNDEDILLVTDDFLNGVFLKRELTPERFRSRTEDYFGKSMLPWLYRTFPDFLVLPDGKRAKYIYDEDGLVEISARLEDLLPLRGGHYIADGKVKVRYDILAPNYRTVQKTWDLTGFWKNTYPEVRKELRGRYPRHKWPETVL